MPPSLFAIYVSQVHTHCQRDSLVSTSNRQVWSCHLLSIFFFICFPFIMCPQEWTQGGTGVFLWFSDITESLVYINVWYTYRSELSLSIKEHLQLPISSIPHLY